MQSMYCIHEFVTVNREDSGRTKAYIVGAVKDVGTDIFERGRCLPSNNKMTVEEQDKEIETIKSCF